VPFQEVHNLYIAAIQPALFPKRTEVLLQLFPISRSWVIILNIYFFSTVSSSSFILKGLRPWKRKVRVPERK